MGSVRTVGGVGKVGRVGVGEKLKNIYSHHYDAGLPLDLSRK